ncbi:spondin domain-containing protein [Shewanella intestini]|nr:MULTISPECIES: spondin domain-containing protein [Shewanella]
MKFMTLSNKNKLIALATCAVLISGCSDDDDDPMIVQEDAPAPVVMQTFDVTVTNLSANQPLSPVFIATHGADQSLWMAGAPASVAIEKLAEGGDSSDLTAISSLTHTVNGNGPIMPGMSETLTLSINEADVASISLATMLVNTNDAFAGVNNYDLTTMAVDDSSMMTLWVYDAGTEANSEAKGSMPGPADGGEGYNSVRDDVDFIHVHPGVISMYDGLADSVLTPSHRFDNPAISVKITRAQ